MDEKNRLTKRIKRYANLGSSAGLLALKFASSKFLNSDTDIFVIAWTTTPWTLPSNTALTVGPKIKYSLIRSFNQYTGMKADYIVAEDLISKQFSNVYYESDNLQDLAEYEFNAKLSCSQIFDCGTKKGFVNANIAFYY